MQHGGGWEARVGFLKEKTQGLWGNEGGVSLLFFWAVASGLKDVHQDNGLSKGPGCSQVQEGQSDHLPLWLVSDVYYGREFRLSLRLPSKSGQLSQGQSRGLETGLTGS